MDWSSLDLVWRGDVPTDEIIALVREDIKFELTEITSPRQVVFHNIFLSDDYDEGPTVVISGFKDRDDAWDAGYYPS